MVKLIKIEGISPKYTKKLHKIGIHTTERLLLVAAHRQGRIDLAKETSIAQKLILEWVNLADLIRIKGIGEQYSNLLEEVGVDTVKELTKRRAHELYQAVVDLNLKNLLVRRLPAIKDIERWIRDAKRLTPMVKH